MPGPCIMLDCSTSVPSFPLLRTNHTAQIPTSDHAIGSWLERERAEEAENHIKLKGWTTSFSPCPGPWFHGIRPLHLSATLFLEQCNLLRLAYTDRTHVFYLWALPESVRWSACICLEAAKFLCIRSVSSSRDAKVCIKVNYDSVKLMVTSTSPISKPLRYRTVHSLLEGLVGAI